MGYIQDLLLLCMKCNTPYPHCDAHQAFQMVTRVGFLPRAAMRRLHLHSSAQLFMEEHPESAQPLTQQHSPSKAQPRVMVPNVGRILQSWGKKGAGASSGSKQSPLSVITRDIETENHHKVYSFAPHIHTNSLEVM